MTVPENVRPFAKVLLLPELVYNIAKYLAPRERHHARRISKAFHRAFQPYISLELAHTLFGNDSDPEKLSIPLEQVPSCGQLVRKYSTTYRGDVHRMNKARAQVVIETALTHCSNVQELSFDWNFMFDPNIEAILAGFTSLTSLSLTMAINRALCIDRILRIITRANLRHLRSLALSDGLHWSRAEKWSVIEDLLDACPSLCDLAMVRWSCSSRGLQTQHSRPNWYLTADDVEELKSYPQLTSLRVSQVPLSGKELIFFSHCFPKLHSLEMDNCRYTWTEPVFRFNNPKPKANDAEPGPGARFLNLIHLRQLKIRYYEGFFQPWHHSLRKMIKQMPRLSSVEIDYIPCNVPSFREMVLHCSKPEVDQSIKRLWIKLDMKGRHNHWEVQALLSQPCFRNLKELWVEKERILADVKTNFRFPFSSTLTTLRLGLPRVRFDDLTLSNLNRVVFPNLPNLEVLILDCRLHGYDLFRGLGYSPADEQPLPKVAYCGTFGIYPEKVPTPPPDVATPDVNGVPPGELTVVSDTLAGVIEAPSEVVAVLVDGSEASFEEAAVMPENVEAPAMVVTATSENGMAPTIEAVTLAEAVSPSDTIDSAIFMTTEVASPMTADSVPVTCRSDHPVIVQLATSMDASLSIGAALTEDTIVKDSEKMPPMVAPNVTQSPEWKYGALRHLQELEITFTSSFIVHMSDIDSQLIQRFPSLECLTIESKKVHGYEEWRREARQQENPRLSMMEIIIF
ncbi:hypothetical protein BGZ94_000198 [Podila epigama]|nr:hypothetical protein BGZ94_000198 [Podila epigama]